MLAEQSLQGLHIDEASLPGLWCGEDRIETDLLASAKESKHSYAYLLATFDSKSCCGHPHQAPVQQLPKAGHLTLSSASY